MECIYCSAALDDLDRCGTCGKGQPVEVAESAQRRYEKAAPAAVPGGVPFVVGVILIVLGLFLPFAALAGWIFVFIGAGTFASEVWGRLDHVEGRKT